MKLLIVESPAKARTIGKYLPAADDYVIRASVGHIRDLPKSNAKAIDIAGGFVPHYEVSEDKKHVVAELRSLAKKADAVVLATDPDREGEAIAWHLVEALGLGAASNVSRVTFHEITREAVQEAMQHPRAIDQNLRAAQEARRVLDRLVGYDLSGVIWKKVRYGLSAGRVQSPALRILVERERDIRAFVAEIYNLFSGTFRTAAGVVLTLTHTTEPRPQADAAAIRADADRIVAAGMRASWTVADVRETPATRNPGAPFTTSTLQQAASSRLGFAPSRTMRAAQKLYEAGHITYMRTDSVTLSEQVLPQIAAVVERDYGRDTLQTRRYKNTSKNAQEAHEAVRPTAVTVVSAGATEDERRLYALIRTRTIASQMVPARILRTRIAAAADADDVPQLTVSGAVLLSPGFLACDSAARGEDTELPKVAVGDALTLTGFAAEEKRTEPPKRYTEAGLVKELEKRGIGRPSTYAAIIKTIQDRGYVDKDGRTLLPTDTGMVVSGFLEEHFPSYISDSFTAEMENELDEIADGRRAYVATLRDFYTPFHADVKAKEKIDKVTTLGDADPAHVCPACGGAMVVKLGKNGTFLSCRRFPDCDGARTMDGVEMTGPKEIGEACPECGKPLVERVSRAGVTFIACSGYPKCTYVKKDEAEEARRDTGVACPTCGKGTMVERKGRFGLFYSCSAYPACKNAIKARPTGNLCTYVREDRGGARCGALMMEGTKTIPERCSDKACPNHNPHKLTPAGTVKPLSRKKKSAKTAE